jgi:hypothetical protein
VPLRLQQRDERGARPSLRRLIRRGRPDFQDDVGGLPERVGRVGQRGARGGIRVIGDAGEGAGASLDGDFEAELAELANGLGSGGDTPLTRENLSRDSDTNCGLLAEGCAEDSRKRRQPLRENNPAGTSKAARAEGWRLSKGRRGGIGWLIPWQEGRGAPMPASQAGRALAA